MNYTKPIVVGIDFSPASSMVLRHAARLAREEGVPLIALHVVDTSRLSHWLSGRMDEAEETRIVEEAKAKLAALVAAEPSDVGAEQVVITGRPAEEIQTVIDDREAGLLVIAANDLSKKRLGLTASSCVRLAHSDVLILRDHQEQPFRKIVSCVDLLGNSGLVLERGIEAAKHYGAELNVVHVIYPPERDLWGEAMKQGGPSAEAAERTRAKALNALKHSLDPF
ncbi:MAG: universal stress protein, partial [Verrucomicrobiota bacterium]